MGLNFTVILLLNLLSVPSLFVLSCKTYKMKKKLSLTIYIFISKESGEALGILSCSWLKEGMPVPSLLLS